MDSVEFSFAASERGVRFPEISLGTAGISAAHDRLVHAHGAGAVPAGVCRDGPDAIKEGFLWN